MHKGVIVKALLDSGAIGMFANKKFVEINGLKLEKLEKAIKIRNVDSTENSKETVIHEIKCNMYYREHVEKMRLYIL